MLISNNLPIDRSRLLQSDRILTITGTKWSDYQKFNSEEYPGYRVSYFKGEIIIVSPGLNHEIIAEVINRLIIAYCERFDILDFPFRQTRLEVEGKAGKEPDIAYSFNLRKSLPELVVEVIFTSGDIKQLKTSYEIIGIPELWIWKDSEMTFYYLVDGKYVEISNSNILPKMESLSLTKFVNRGIQESPSIIKKDFIKLLTNN